MILSRMFLFLIGVTIILSGLQLFGYQILELIVIMIVVDFLTLGAMFHLEKNVLIKNNPISIENDVVPRLEKIDKIEKNSADILSHISGSDNSILESKLKKQSDDITYLLDKMAKKTLELEQRINKFGNGLLDSMSSLDKRVESLEKKEPQGQTIPMGELIYGEDNKNT